MGTLWDLFQQYQIQKGSQQASSLEEEVAQLKNEIASLLDRLMQADMEIAFNVKNGVTGAFSGKTAM